MLLVCFFFFKQKTAYDMRISDWSSDVCSSDLLPVLDKNGEVVGIVDESDILMKVFHDDTRFKDAVASAMTSRLETVDAAQPLEDLLPIFARDHVAIVFRGGTFMGLITRIDLLNHLRRRMR